MSEDNGNAALIAQILAEISEKNKEIAKTTKEKEVVDGKIEKLKEAAAALEKALDNIRASKKTLLATLGTFEPDTFEGDRRTKYKRTLKEAGEAIDQMIKDHNENMSTIETKIKLLEDESRNLGLYITSLETEVIGLEATLRSLR